MKKIVLTLIFLFLITPNASAAFTDVSSSHIYNTGITFVQNRNIVSGYSDGSYRPNNLITRAEFTKVIVNAIYNSTDIDNCIALNGVGTQVFPDVSYSHILAKYICMAKSKDLIDGFSDGNFKPDEYITFGEASKILAEGFNLISSRIELRSYAVELVERRYVPAQIRALNEYITRGQMAEMIYRIKENNRGREAVKESALYDRIITLEFYGYDAANDKLTGQVLDGLNYSVFKNSLGEMLTLNIDEKSSRAFLNDLKSKVQNNDDSVKTVVYILDNKIKYGFIFELNGVSID